MKGICTDKNSYNSIWISTDKSNLIYYIVSFDTNECLHISRINITMSHTLLARSSRRVRTTTIGCLTNPFSPRQGIKQKQEFKEFNQSSSSI